MSQPPTEPRTWNLGDQYRHSDERGVEAPGSGRATARGQVYGQPPSAPQTYGQPPSASGYGRATATPQVYGQPPSAPQTYGQPPSVSGYGQPPTSPPAYGQPTSASPYQQPASTPPAYGVPQPTFAGESPRWKKPRPILLVALVAGLLFVMSGVMTVLFFMKSTELTRAEGELRSQGAQVDQLRKDLQTANDRAAKSQQDLTGTKNARDELARQKQVISRCLKLLGEAGNAARDGDQSAYNDAIEEAEPVCKEADRYL